MKKGLLAGVAVGVLFLGAACSSKPEPAETTAPEATTEVTVAPTTEATEVVDDSASAVIVSAPANAMTIGFEPTAVEVVAGEEFVLTFNNDDTGIPHNVQIFEGADIDSDVLWAPKDNATINGVASVDYEIPALDAGTYAFNCYVHPTMVGTITAA